MAEMERFERELRAALIHYADEVPTKVDAVEVARALHGAESRRRSWVTLPGLDGARPALRLAVVLAALLGLSIGMIALARLIGPTPGDITLTGRMICTGAAWTATSSPVALTCRVDLHDERATGVTVLRIDAPAGIAGLQTRTGAFELPAAVGGWSGDVHLAIAPSGAVTGEAVLVGDGSVAGRTLRLSVSSADGLAWGVRGVIRTDG